MTEFELLQDLWNCYRSVASAFRAASIRYIKSVLEAAPDNMIAADSENIGRIMAVQNDPEESMDTLPVHSLRLEKDHIIITFGDWHDAMGIEDVVEEYDIMDIAEMLHALCNQQK